MTTREVLKELSRRGRQPDFRFDVPAGAKAIGQQLKALAESRPVGVLIIAGAEDAARLVVAVRERFPSDRQHPLTPSLAPSGGEGARRAGEGDSGCLIFGSHSMARSRFPELAGQAAEGVRFPLLFVPSAADTNTARFTGRFIAEHHRPPDYTAALTYDATRLLLEAIRRAGPNRARIREGLTQLSPWPGIAGPIRFDGTGQNTRSNVCMGTIRDGSVVPLLPREPVKHSEP
jgi:hypothetical protein